MKDGLLERARPSLIKASNVVQRMLLPLGLQASRTVNGHKIRFDPATDIGMHLLVTGHFEPQVIAQCATFIRPDSIVLDVGANIGVHTVHFAGCAPQGKVICFEPARATFDYLLRNITKLPNVVPLNLALSDATGLQTFFVAADNGYSSLKDTRRKAILREETVACFRADDLLPPLLRERRVDFIKIDVEGLEMQVLQGMRELLTVHRPAILCEIFGGEHSNPDPEATVRFCVALGYDAFVLSGEELVPAAVHDDRLYNYFFVPRQRP
jgi:FkbM family methyltransferase